MKSEEYEVLKTLPIHQVNISKRQILCAEGKQATSTCFKKNCDKNAFICQSKGCRCKQEHKECFRKIDIQDIQIILERKQKLFRQIGSIIETQMKNAIDQLSHLEEKLKKQLQNLSFCKSFSVTDMLVSEALRTGQVKQVKGKHIYQIHEGLEKRNIKQHQILKEKISACWQKYKEAFRILTSSLNGNLLNKNTNKVLLQKEPGILPLLRESSIIKNQESVQKMMKLFTKQIKTIQKLFQASSDSFKAKQFHAKCDKIPNTLTIIETTKGKIMGGFTPCEWNSSVQQCADNSRQSFVFQLNNNDKFVLKIEKTAFAIYNNPNYGPIFGGNGERDIFIQDDANINSYSLADIGSSYQNALYTKGDANSQARFSGFYYFKVKDYEVWKVIFK